LSRPAPIDITALLDNPPPQSATAGEGGIVVALGSSVSLSVSLGYPEPPVRSGADKHRPLPAPHRISVSSRPARDFRKAWRYYALSLLVVVARKYPGLALLISGRVKKRGRYCRAPRVSFG
jgi:hypothetical protein